MRAKMTKLLRALAALFHRPCRCGDAQVSAITYGYPCRVCGRRTA
jgi:hypothetical protein